MKTQSARLLQQFYDLPFIGIAISSPTTKRWLKYNDRLCEILGYSRDEMASISWPEMTHPDDLAADVTRFDEMLRGESDGYTLDKRFIRKDGTTVFTTLDVKCVRRADGGVESVFATMQDITGRRQAEAKIKRLTQIYAALSETNQAIVRCTSQDELFPQICRFAVQFGGMKTAWIGLVDPDTRLVRPTASFGDDTDALHDLQVSVDPEIPFGRGPTGIAVRELRAFWVQDFLADPLLQPWHERGARAGWRASAALPLKVDERAVGALVLYAGEANAFDDEVRKLLVEMAADISFALSLFARAAERRQSEAQLRLAAKVFEQSAEGIVITDAELNIVMVNRAFSGITGYSACEALGQNPRMMFSGHHDEHFYRAVWEAVRRCGHWHGEIWSRRKNGEVYPELASISQVLDTSGTVSHYVGIFTDISEHKANEAHIQHLAHFDVLTGLPNRSLLADRVGQAISRVERADETMALVFLDLDRFKNVNDSLGHRIGDELLIQVAARLKLTLREEDTVSRLGGDEFILVLPGATADGAAHVAEKVIKVLSTPYRIEQHELTITPSLGIAMFPADGENYEALSMCADAAMYRAKHSGRHTFRFFTREMQERSERTLLLENALRRVLELDQLQLHYQPQVSLESGRIIGVEALLRWRHPDLGWVPPSDFVPVSEDSGLILPIGDWVLRTAVRQVKAWKDAGLASMVMAVNLSVVQFRQSNLPELIAQILDEFGVAPDGLELELTEGVAMENPLAAISVMNDLHARGIRMSIDDFGTGYSSLSYLKRFKVYKLKIDQSFVCDISSDPEGEAIVEAIIGLSRSLGLQTIAEGVETDEQLAFLRAKGCHEAQGYRIARPMPAEAFAAFVRGYRPPA